MSVKRAIAAPQRVHLFKTTLVFDLSVFVLIGLRSRLVKENKTAAGAPERSLPIRAGL
jgi:hypothetical protein